MFMSQIQDSFSVTSLHQPMKCSFNAIHRLHSAVMNLKNQPLISHTNGTTTPSNCNSAIIPYHINTCYITNLLSTLCTTETSIKDAAMTTIIYTQFYTIQKVTCTE